MNDKLDSPTCSKFMKGLADSERLRIVQCLLDGPKCVGAIARQAGGALANVSHHLLVLKQCGLVSSERRGKFVYYSVEPSIFVSEGPGGPALNFGCCRVELGAPKKVNPPKGRRRAG